MREETFSFSPRYARRNVMLHDQQGLIDAASHSGVIVCHLHYGSWILAGGAIAHSMRLPFTAIASRRNLEIIPHAEKAFWQGVHRRGSILYGQDLIYSDQSPRLALEWLRTKGHTLGVALDVREHAQQYKEYPMQFLGKTVYMQIGPARLACMAKVPMVPAIMHYCPKERRHHLYFGAPILPDASPQQMTQCALAAMEKYVMADTNQQFYDIAAAFSHYNTQMKSVSEI